MMVFLHGGDLDPITLWGFILFVLAAFGGVFFGLIYLVARLAKTWGERYEDNEQAVNGRKDSKDS